jgi:predicted HTH domain antitoxin
MVADYFEVIFSRIFLVYLKFLSYGDRIEKVLRPIFKVKRSVTSSLGLFTYGYPLMNISFSVNDDILLSLKETIEEFTQDIRFLSALMWYRKNRLSLGKAAELAGYSKLDFIERMKLENEPIFDYSAAEIAEIFTDADKLP